MKKIPEAKPGHPAVFLDRDGTLIEDVGFLSDIEKILYYSDTVDALNRLQEHYMLFVITNQSGVADGLITLDDVHRVNAEINRVLAGEGITIHEWYVCPHNKADACRCRKPGTEFIKRARRDHCVELRESFAIGDHPHDAALGRELGVRGLYLLTGHGRKHQDELESDEPIFESLGQAAEWIEQQAL